MKYICNFVLAAAVISCLCAEDSPVDIEWQVIARLPEPGAGHSVVVMNERILAMGGTNWNRDKKIWSRQIFELDPGLKKWTVKDELPTSAAYAAAGYFNRQLVISGGCTSGPGSGRNTGITMVKKNGHGTWAVLKDRTAVTYGAAFCQGGKKLFACGGLEREKDSAGISNTILSMDILQPENGWKKLAEVPVDGLFFPAICVSDKYLYIFGGADACWHNRSEYYRMNLIDFGLEYLGNMPVASRCSLALPYGKYIILIVNCKNSSDGSAEITDMILLFDPASSTWHPCGPLPWKAVVDGIVDGNRIYLIGGEDKARSRCSDCAIGTIRLKK